MLETQTKAPDFCLPSDNGTNVCLKDFLGKQILLYFYPKDDTPGCTKEACEIKDNHSSFTNANVVVLGISKDSKESHEKFKEKYELPFALLSDENCEVIKKYKAEKEDGGTKRISYLINEVGEIIKAYEKVEPATHAQEVLADATLLNL